MCMSMCVDACIRSLSNLIAFRENSGIPIYIDIFRGSRPRRRLRFFTAVLVAFLRLARVVGRSAGGL